MEQSNGQQPPRAEQRPVSSSTPPGWEPRDDAEGVAGSGPPAAVPGLSEPEPVGVEEPLRLALTVQLAPPASPLGWQMPANPSRPEPQRTLRPERLERPQTDTAPGVDVPRLQLAPPPAGYAPQTPQTPQSPQPPPAHEQQAPGVPAARPLLAPVPPSAPPVGAPPHMAPPQLAPPLLAPPAAMPPPTGLAPPAAAPAPLRTTAPAHEGRPAAALAQPPPPPVTDTSAPAKADLRLSRGTESDTGDENALLFDLLVQVLERGASDLHLTAGSPPVMRTSGQLVRMDGYENLTPQVIQKMVYAIITQKQRERFEEALELDFAYSVPGKARFRVNLYKQRDSVGAAFRLIPYEIKKLDDLGVPPSVASFATLPRGFVLVTGPTGSGKSTTLAAIIDMANRTRREHIMTVEDPIEFLHQHQQCLVNQREVGEDTHSFQNALKHALRQDPDIILVGELRDLETISVALTAAETGHLVFATLHTQDAAQTIDRIIDVFPPAQQQQVRVQLAGTLQGIVCQDLPRTADGKGRAAACEVLVATPAIRNLIREGKTHQIYSALQAGTKFGMQTMDQHLADLVKRGRITYDTGIEKCHHADDFNRLCGRN